MHGILICSQINVSNYEDYKIVRYEDTWVKYYGATVEVHAGVWRRVRDTDNA